MAYVPKYGQFGTSMKGPDHLFGSATASAGTQPLSWDQLESESNAIMGKGRRRQGHGTRSAFANNGEFSGSSDELTTMTGQNGYSGGVKPRALFVSEDGSPMLTWNEIERFNMDDLNSALGPFNPGSDPRAKKRKGRTFRGFRRGNGEGFVDAKKTSGMISLNSSTPGRKEESSPLQSKRKLRRGNMPTQKGSGMRPRQPRARK